MGGKNNCYTARLGMTMLCPNESSLIFRSKKQLSLKGTLIPRDLPLLLSFLHFLLWHPAFPSDITLSVKGLTGCLLGQLRDAPQPWNLHGNGIHILAFISWGKWSMEAGPRDYKLFLFLLLPQSASLSSRQSSFLYVFTMPVPQGRRSHRGVSAEGQVQGGALGGRRRQRSPQRVREAARGGDQ